MAATGFLRGAAALLLLSMAEAKPVQMTIFMEASCPFCLRFMNEQVAPLWADPVVKSAVGIHWVPYGMGQTAMNGFINCQHGPDECVGNRVELCARERFGESDAWTDFMLCAAKFVAAGQQWSNPATYEQCAPGLSAQLAACASSDHSLQLAQQAGQETQAATPTQVPWVCTPETPTYNLAGFPFKDIVCSEITQKGLPAPGVCAGVPMRRLRMANATLV